MSSPKTRTGRKYHHGYTDIFQSSGKKSAESELAPPDLLLSVSARLFEEELEEPLENLVEDLSSDLLIEEQQQRSQSIDEILLGNMPAKRSVSKKRKQSGSVGKLQASKISNNLLGYLNPFAGVDPVIPDGSVVESLGTMHKNAFVLSIPAGEVGHIIMYPGASEGYLFATTATPETAVAVGDVKHRGKFTAPEAFLTNSTPFQWDSTATTAGNFTTGTVQSGGAVTKWRMVSQGLRLSLLNTDSRNDGWFESCRMQTNLALTDFEIDIPVGNANTTTQQVTLITNATNPADVTTVQARHNIFSGFDTANLAENAGYSSGPLKMVGAAVWQLLPFTQSHEFNEIDEKYNFDPGTIGVLGDSIVAESTTTSAITLLPLAGDDSCKDLVKGYSDWNHDFVYIRIHGGINETKLLANHVANHEVVYNTSSILHKHMVRTTVDKNYIKARATKLAAGQPGRPVNP